MRRGHTLIEVLVCTALFGLLLGMVLAIYVTGASAWSKGDARTELVGAAQVAMTSLVHDFESSSTLGLSVAPDGQSAAAISYLDDQGAFVLDDQGRPIWQKWIVYSFRNGELWRREEPWPLPAAARANPVPIEQLSPPLTVVDYLAGGRAIARNVHAVQFALLPDGNVSLKIELRKHRYGSPAPEKVVLSSVVRARN